MMKRKILNFNDTSIFDTNTPTQNSDGSYTTTTGLTCFVDENNRLHNDNGPAVFDNFAYKAYYVDGLLSRLDGPAVVSGGQECWWIDGVQYDEVEYYYTIKKLNKMKDVIATAHPNLTVSGVELYAKSLIKL